jgi:WD40 repeat protein
VVLDPTNRTILTVAARFLRTFDAETGELLLTFEGRGDGGRASDQVGFSPDGRHAVSHAGSELSPDGAITVWEVATGKILRRFDGTPASRVSSVDGLRFRVLGRGRSDHRAWLLDLESEASLALEPPS